MALELSGGCLGGAWLENQAKLPEDSMKCRISTDSNIPQFRADFASFQAVGGDLMIAARSGRGQAADAFSASVWSGRGLSPL